MIFVTLGSQKFQFNRLLKEIDRLVEEGKINEEVFAQIGYSDYIPRNYQYKEFLDRDEFNEIMNICEKVITHGGTGAIVGSVKKGKKVISIPRLSKFGEHVDDHQLQIVKQFSELDLIYGCYNIEELEISYEMLDNKIFNKYYSNTITIINSIENFIVSI